MLSIRRVPTLVSCRQEELQGCGKDCLGSCCVPGSQLPLYSFARRYSVKPKRVSTSGDLHTVPDTADVYLGTDPFSNADEEKSFLSSLLLAEWEDRMQRGLFRYDVTACETKTLPGDYGFIAQLNEGRHLKKRPTEFRVDKVLQDFDAAKFNFTKVSQEEVLFRFEESNDGSSEYFEEAPVLHSPNVVVINVSPIEYGHVLLVPRVLDCLPQRIQADTLLLALHMAAEADNPYFRLGYNSLGAFATINQLHFQAYFLDAPFPIERAPTSRIACKKRKRGLKIASLRNYPVRALVLQVGNSLEEMAVVLGAICAELELRNIPFNILIADRGARIFLMPQCFAEKQARQEVPQELLECQVNPAAWEISGHIVLKRREDYANATQDNAWRLLAEVSLSEDDFNEVMKMATEEADRAVEESLPLFLVSSMMDDTGLSTPEAAPAPVQKDEKDPSKLEPSGQQNGKLEQIVPGSGVAKYRVVSNHGGLEQVQVVPAV